MPANKAIVTVKGLDEWPGEYQKQFGTMDLYWIICDGGLMLLLSQLLLTKESFESCKIQVFCIAEENTEAEELKTESGTVRQGDSLTKMPMKKKCLFVKTGAVVLCRIQVNDTICTGYSALLWHILKGPASKFHSRAEQTLRLLLDRFTYSISTNKCHGDDAIVEVVIRTVQRLCKELKREELGLLWDCLLEEMSCLLPDMNLEGVADEKTEPIMHHSMTIKPPLDICKILVMYG